MGIRTKSGLRKFPILQLSSGFAVEFGTMDVTCLKEFLSVKCFYRKSMLYPFFLVFGEVIGSKNAG